jgi:hypothetical protein
MKKLILFTILILSFSSLIKAQSDYTVDLARQFGKDIFELNGVPYLQPMVESINVTTNSRFFNTAYIPEKVDKPYFKFSINGMLGFIPDEKDLFTPVLPSASVDLEELSKYMEYNFITGDITILDTAGLIHYAFLVVINEGLQEGSIKVPTSASTIMGNKDTVFYLPNPVLKDLVKNLNVGGINIYEQLPVEMQQQLDSVVAQFPETFNLPPGADINTLAAGVPQIEVGSLWGTELLLRFIPPVDMGKNVGDFAFWGIGIKHSISQYFRNRPFDMAVQFIYQGTHLENEVGVTKAELTANANMYNFNVQFSKNIEDIFDIYTAISYDMIYINSSYRYFLPVEIQWELGLLEWPNHGPTPGYPGDQNPQVTNLTLEDSNLKWTIGLKKDWGPVTFFADFNLGIIDIFTGGIQYTF